MKYVLSLTESTFRRLADARPAPPGRVIVCPAGLARLHRQTEWLLHDVNGRSDLRPPGASVRVVAAESPRQLAERVDAALADDPSAGPTAVLGLGVRRAAGWVAGKCRTAAG